jgi:hypothetical protein
MAKRIFRLKVDAVNRNAAKLKGSSEFISDVPCLHGHIIRSTHTGQCKECSRARSWNWIRRSAEVIETEKERCRVKSEKRRRENPAVAYGLTAAWRKSSSGKAAIKIWRAKNSEKLEAGRRKSRGLPEPTRVKPEKCECCGSPPGNRSLHLDHCHTTGVFRGWLCVQCNTGLGMFKENPELLARAICYLNRYDPAASERAKRFNTESDIDDITPAVSSWVHAA